MPYPATTTAGLVLPEPGLENLDVATFNKNMQAIDTQLTTLVGKPGGYSFMPSAGFVNLDRRLIQQSNINLVASGQMNLVLFKAETAQLITNLNVATGTTAAAATPTICRMGLYTVAANGDMTLVASTPNDTTLFAAANTVYTKALSSTYTLVSGQVYATGLLVVSGTTLPNFYGLRVSSAIAGNAALDTIVAIKPRIFGASGVQSDLPASITEASIVTASQAAHYEDSAFIWGT